MQVIALRTLRQCWEKHPQAEIPLRTWHAIVQRADWRTPANIRAEFRSADFVANNRVIFNIGGNKFRLVALIAYRTQRVFIKFVDTHEEYDKIDPLTCQVR